MTVESATAQEDPCLAFGSLGPAIAKILFHKDRTIADWLATDAFEGCYSWSEMQRYRVQADHLLTSVASLITNLSHLLISIPSFLNSGLQFAEVLRKTILTIPYYLSLEGHSLSSWMNY